MRTAAGRVTKEANTIANGQFQLGIIGCGWVAELHARALHRVPEIKVVALADSEPVRLAAFKEKFGLQDCLEFQDYERLLAVEDIDLVSISAPNHWHKEMLIHAAEAGKHVICEKPLANNLPDADEMIETMRLAGLKLGVYHEMVFYPENLLIRKLLAEQAAGATRFAWLGAYALGKWVMTPWRVKAAHSGGGIVMDEGVHLAHLAKLYFGAEPVRVSASIDRLGTAESGDVEDVGSLTFEFPTGLAQAAASYMPAIGRDHSMRTYSQGIITDRLSMELVFGAAAESVASPVEKIVVTSSTGVSEHAMPPYQDALDKNVDAFRRLYMDFIDSVKNDRTPAVDGQSARDAQEMIMAAFESAATGRAVRIPMDTASPVYREGVVGIKQLASEIPVDSILRRKRLYGLGPA